MNTLSSKKGFTLIETLFAILIFSSALVALMTIAGRGISATSSARQQIAAHYLAQEGLEVVRNMRDANFVTHRAWGTGFAAECTDASPCDVDYSPMPTEPPMLKNTTGSFLEVDPATGFFIGSGLNNGTPTSFSRSIWIEPADNSTDVVTGNTGPSEYRVVSRVAWEFKGIPRVVELRTLLKKWQ